MRQSPTTPPALTLRKKNASVVFATQSLADIDGSAIAPAIIEILSHATPKCHYYCPVAARQPVSDVALAFTAASSKTDQAAIAEVLAASGRGGFAAAWLRHRGLGWAADMLAEKETAA